MKQVAAVLAGVALTLAITVGPAAAQSVELGGGLAWANGNLGWANGFAVDVAATVRNGERTAISIVGDWSLVSRNGDDYMPIGGGVRFKFLRTSRVSPLVQATGGILVLPETTVFFVGAGGGIQVRLSHLLDAKSQLDVVIAPSTVAPLSDQVSIRLFFGAVFKFGNRY